VVHPNIGVERASAIELRLVGRVAQLLLAYQAVPTHFPSSSSESAGLLLKSFHRLLNVDAGSFELHDESMAENSKARF